MSLDVVLETPFMGEVATVGMPEGMSIHDMSLTLFGSTDNVSAWFPTNNIMDPFYDVPVEKWKRIKPKAGSGFRFIVGPRGGGETGKNVLAVVAAIAVSVIAPYLAGTVLGLTGPTLLAATGAFTAIGLYGVSFLFPPSTPNQGKSSEDNAKDSYESISVGSNLLEPGAPLPYVAGLRRITPPLLAQPHYFLDADGYPNVRLIYGLAGYHYLSDFQIGETPVEDLDGVTIETQNASSSAGVTTFVDKITYLVQAGNPFVTFKHNSNAELEAQSRPHTSEPAWERVVTRPGNKLEEFYVRLSFTGLIDQTNVTAKVGLPIRVRLRLRGTTTWKNLPEIHFNGISSTPFLKEFRFRWDGNFNDAGTSTDIRTDYWRHVPAIAGTLTLTDGTVAADGYQWEADPYFSSGSGVHDVDNIDERRRGINITLDETEFPKGSYEVEFKVGGQYVYSSLNQSTYSYSGLVTSMFYGAKTSSTLYKVFLNQSQFGATAQLEFATSVYDQIPWTKNGAALIAMQVVNQSVPSFSVLAGAYVDDYNPATEDWDIYGVSKNPAPHFRNICTFDFNAGRVDLSLLDNDALVDWWTECDDKGYEVSAVLSGQTLTQAKQMIAAAGFGKARSSDLYGVYWHADRSNDPTVQHFSPLNVQDVTWVKSFEKIPGGITVTFKDETNNYATNEINIANPVTFSNTAYVAVEYDNITNPTLARLRGKFELLQMSLQTITWSFSTGINHIRARRGDLIGLSVESVSDLFTASFIRQAISLDTFKVVQRFDVATTSGILSLDEFFAQENIFHQGIEYGMAVQTVNGIETRKITNVVGNVIQVASNFSGSLADFENAHVTIGPLEEVVKKCIVVEVRPTANENASVTAVEYIQKVEELLRDDR